MTNKDYQAICMENAERFLKTAFLLDDEVIFGEEIITTSKSDTAPTEPPTLKLNGKAMTESFFKKGIVLSIIRPEKDGASKEDLETNILDAIQQVDLPILDWNLWGDDGAWVIVILKRLIEEYHYPEGRVALIMIYTEQEASHVYDKLREDIDGWELETEDSNLLAMGGLRVRIAKRDEALDEKMLPTYLVQEFSKIHQGILENAVIQAISEIREKTYHLLSRFPKKLDAPFLAHRAVLKNPDDSGEHAFEMITSEITSLLVQSNLPEKVFHSLAIPFAVDAIPESKLKKIRYDGDNTQTRIIRKELKILLKDGASKKAKLLKLNDHTRLPLGSDKRKILISKITELLAADDASMLDEELSELFAFQNNYPGFVPKLTLGCIVEKRNNDASLTYLLCMLPFCDSERIKTKISIPFLVLEQVQTSTDDFNLAIPDVARLRIQYNPRNIRSYIFTPSKIQERVITFAAIVFRTTGKVKLKWVATLKRDYAQRIANEFGAHVSRVGLNESEWQRLHSRKKS